MVTGTFNLEKLLKTLKKKTRKNAKVLMVNEQEDDGVQEDEELEEDEEIQEENDEHETITENNENPEVEEQIDTAQTSTKEVEIHLTFLCDKLEKDVGKVISKFEGVKTCDVDIVNQKIVITGDFDKEKLLKKLKKRMRKRIQKMEKKKRDEEHLRGVYINPSTADERYMMFSDENPNACCIS
ncbi:hypothetical protein CARUB_v10006850mg [Capsella rubella]|uniref:HMA domain-containing protein n=2 Tax=Capsella rubella TaxID=81985 RepID=R0F9I5_9BRAS|nr:hypothetical protein CARUB_v10006850mg [Capsella rubella]